MENEGRGTRHEQEFACEPPRKIQVSQQVLEWQAEARAEVRAEATLARVRKSILRAMELRLCASVPADLTAAVTALNDLDELSRWFDATQTSDSLEAFRAAIGQPPRIS